MAVRVLAEAAQRSPISNRLRWIFASVGLAAALAGCGGGDDAPAAAPPPPPPPPPPPVATTLTGTAATGAALAGAALQVVDASGATVCETSTAADGVYSCTLAATVQRPLVIRAVKDETVLYSATAATGNTRANVTPLTHIIASRLAPNGDASALAGAIQSITPAALAAQTATLLTALQPLLAAMGNLTIDPVAGELVANGTGQDKLLDAIAVTVRPDGTAANIEITVKTVPTTANPDPVSIRFSSNASTVPALPAAVATADLSGIPAPSVVDALVSRLTACFALPLSQRVNAPNDASPVVGTAADVIAPACRSLFVDDNPATYLSAGSRVGRSASNTGSFAGLFRPGATGLVFSDAKFEYFRTNGDMVVSAKWRDSQGTTANDTYVVRNVGSVLKLIGNQYAYSATVRPFAEDRELLNTPQFSYFTTGYNIRVDNRTDGSGNPIFSKVVVTTPWGGTYTLLPAAGQALLAIALDGQTPGATSVLRLAAGYRDTARTDDPSVKESNLVYTAPLRTDADILALQDQGRWSFEFFHADTSVPNVVQASRTLVRPYTIGEIRLRPFAQFTASTRADLVAESSALGYALFTQPDTAQLGDASAPAWTVPIGALAPTSAGVYGRAPHGSTTPNVIGNRFDDVAGVSSTARFATIFCSAQTASDKHCDASTPGLYAVNTLVSQVELWGLGEKQVEFSKKGGLYKLQ